MSFSILTPEQHEANRAVSGLVLCRAPFGLTLHGTVMETLRCNYRARYVLSYHEPDAPLRETEMKSLACGVHMKPLLRRLGSLPPGWEFTPCQ